MSRFIIIMCMLLPTTLFADVIIDCHRTTPTDALLIPARGSIKVRFLNFPEERTVTATLNSAFSITPTLEQTGFDDIVAKWKAATRELEIKTHTIDGASRHQHIIMILPNPSDQAVHVTISMNIEPPMPGADEDADADAARSVVLPNIPRAAENDNGRWSPYWIAVPVVVIAGVALYAYSQSSSSTSISSTK